MNDYEALRKTAEAVPNCAIRTCDDPAHEWFHYGELHERFIDSGIAREAAEYVAAIKPSVVLDLIARLETAEAAIERVRALADEWMFDQGDLGNDTFTIRSAASAIRAALDQGDT